MEKSLCILSSALLVFSTFAVAAEPPQTEFAFNLYRTIVKDTPNENVMISSYGAGL
jgi:serine protease inhibitor